MVTELEKEQMFQDHFDEVIGEVKIGPYIYSAAKALKEVDPTAYICEFRDWLDYYEGPDMGSLD